MGAQGLGVEAAVVRPPGQLLGDRLDAVEIEAQGPAHVAQHRAAAVADDHRRHGGPVAAVFPVDVLDDLLAPLMLEVEVDVGRLLALFADEALEQKLRAGGVDLGHPQAVADRRVGRAAAALAKNALPARPMDQVRHREKERLIGQARDEHQLALDLVSHRGRLALRIAPAHTLLGEHAQPAGGRVAGRHQLLRVLVAQFIKRERAARGPVGCRLEPGRLIQLGQSRTGPQMGLPVRFQPQAGLRHRATVAGGREHVLQGLARSAVHQHIARGDDGQPGECRHPAGHRHTLFIEAAMTQGQRQPATLGAEHRLQPHGLGEDPAELWRRHTAILGLGAVDHQQGQAIPQTGQPGPLDGQAFEIRRVGQVAALVCTPAGQGDPLRQVPVAALRLRQQDQPRAIA
jgi:hypothetical protein